MKDQKIKIRLLKIQIQMLKMRIDAWKIIAEICAHSEITTAIYFFEKENQKDEDMGLFMDCKEFNKD